MSPFRRRRREEEETAVVEDAPARREVVEEEVPPPPPPRVWPWLLLLLLLVLAGGLAWWLLTREDERTTMPRVVGLTEAEARARIAEAELEPDVDRRRSRRERGVVFAQTPGAGVQLETGERVEIVVSSGVIRVVVPGVRDLEREEAIEKIEAAGLRARTRRVFAGAPVGQVVEQDPRGGERVERGSTVELIVSKGRNLNRVPNVVGLREEAAIRALRAREFDPRIFDVPSEEPRGIVIAQAPVAGEAAPPDSRVRINVSSGEPTGQERERTQTTPTQPTPTQAAGVRVPSVVGQQQTPALRRIRQAGLRSALSYQTSDQPRGRVLAQQPTGGTTLRRGAAVRLTISSGRQAELARVPDVTALNEAEARSTLTDAGFRAEVVLVPTDDPAQDGIVLEQQPAGGTNAPRGSVVTIFVGQSG